MRSKSADLFQKERILCWIMTSPDNHKKRAMAVKNTWGKRCNVLLFMSSEEDPSLPTIKLPIIEGRDQLWGKTREAFRHIWNHYRDQADWFFKADDDTYAILENMRYFLSAYNTSKPLWFGHKFKTIVKQGYFSGGAGYVLSKEATRRFVEEGYFNVLLCRHDHEGAEDAEMGTYTFGNIFSLDKRIKFNVSRLVLCHRKMYESTECLGHGHERCQRQRKIFPVFSRTTHFPWESNKGLLVLAIHLLPRKRGAGMLFGQRNLFSLRQT